MGEGVVVQDPEEAGKGAARLAEDAALGRGVDEGDLGSAGGVQAGEDEVPDGEVTSDPEICTVETRDLSLEVSPCSETWKIGFKSARTGIFSLKNESSIF